MRYRHRVKLAALYLLLPLPGMAQLLLQGRILRSTDSTPVEQVVIIRQHDLVGSLSAADGSFSRTVQPGDVLLLRRVGFVPDTLFVNRYPASGAVLSVVFYLKEKQVELPAFNLSRRKTVTIDNVEKRQEWSHVLDRPRAGAQSPITAMWQAYSKKGRELRKLEQLFYLDEQKRIFAQRFSRLQAYLLTGLTDSQLDDYIARCRPLPEFVQIASDYELIMHMKACFEEWKKLNTIPPADDKK